MKEMVELKLETFRSKLTRQLQLIHPVPMHVARKAQQDSLYYHHLIVARSNPLWLDILFKVAYENHKHGDNIRANDTNAWKLSAKFGSTLVQWSRYGFKQAPPDILDKRWKACQECPHLVQPPDKMLYYLGRRIISRGEDKRICDLCGCFAYTKCNIATQSCPGPHPIYAGLTRWGDTIAEHNEKHLHIRK